MACKEGELIGMEDELIERYGVSRPTLRQAAALVSQEQLVRVRRGVGGGYFSNRPTFTAVAHMAAIFLQSKRTRLPAILEAIEPVRIELARLATVNMDAKIRVQFAEFLAVDERRRGEGYTFRYFLWAERRFGELLGLASKNDVLHLFLEILLDLVATTAPEQDIFIHNSERVTQACLQRARIVSAILDGDPEMAMLEARRGAKRSSDWMLEDMAKGPAAKKKRSSKD